MCRKLICLTSFIVVLALAGNAGAQIDPASVTSGHVYLFENVGTNVPDDSANSNTANLVGNPQVVDGLRGKALQFDGVDDGVHIPDATMVNLSSNQNRTVIAIFKCDDVTKSEKQVVYEEGGTTRGLAIYVHQGLVYAGGWNLSDYTPEWTGTFLSAPISSNSWHAVAMVLRGAGASQQADKFEMWMDGRLIGKGPGGELRSRSNDCGIGYHNSQVKFHDGNVSSTGSYFKGAVDEIWILDSIALTEAELSAWRGKPWPYAIAPSPADGAIHENTWVSLAWAPGALVVSHDVYFGENFDDVNAGAEGTFAGNTASASQIVGFPGFPVPGGLLPGTTYYWRVDEVNSADPNSPWKGEVWSFSVPPRTAYNARPADGSMFVVPGVVLEWSAGLNARLHYVYFGDTFDDVNSATVGSPITATSYTPAGPLERGKTYYWRIDEFDGAGTHKGNVQSFRTIPTMSITDPNLVAWWKLDEGFGTTAADYSGYDRHGTLQGQVFWADGFDGTALEFDGAGDYVTMGGYKGIIGSGARTVSAWVRTTSTTTGVIVGWGPNTATQRMELRIDAGRLRCEHEGGNVQGSTNLTDGGWHHAAVTISNNATVSYPQVKLYLDGVDDTIPTTDPDAFATTAGNDVRIGSRPSNNDRFFTGQIDDVRIYDKELTAQELELVMRIDVLAAWRPRPKDGATPDIEHVTPLTWTRGDKATQHDVYFGLDKAAVADANASDTTGIYRGRQSAASFTPAEGLTWGGGPYFWRVDENNNDGTVTKGRIWSFTVGDFLVVDEIESYNDLLETEPGSNRIYTKWIDGFGTTTNGALVGNLNVPLTEHANVHGGGQAMPLSYDNNLKFSEAMLTLTAGRDWTRQGVGELSLWFRGAATNTAERMYVALNGTAVVYHTDPNVAQTAAWTEWTIPLQTFAGQGVNLANVTSITIGFGTRGNTTTAGGTGQMYIDDIRLYRPRVAP